MGAQNVLSNRQPHQNLNDGSQNRRGRYHPLRSPTDLGGTSLLEAQTRSGILECPPGSYCIGGVRRACPRGRYGASSRLSSPSCDGAAALGHWTRAGAVTAQMKCAPGRHADRVQVRRVAQAHATMGFGVAQGQQAGDSTSAVPGMCTALWEVARPIRCLEGGTRLQKIPMRGCWGLTQRAQRGRGVLR